MSPAPILVVNLGSSSVKLAEYRDGQPPIRTQLAWEPSAVVDWLRPRLPHARAIGHRIVHGGTLFTQPTRITPAVLSQLDKLSAFAPLHMPPAVMLIHALTGEAPTLPQIASFDTSFHATLPPVEQRFGIPRCFHDDGIRRYGFHGLSYESIAAQLPRVSPKAAAGRTVVAHLGSGASLCGMLASRSVTTTMGFSPLDGLLMATRPGRLDPGVLLHWLRQGKNLLEIEQILERESGWLGVSGVSANMQELLASSLPEAAEAVELFCQSVAKEVAAAAVVLGGLDALVFTGGIGEHAVLVRNRIVEKLKWLGTIEVLALPTDEEAVIAKHVAETLP